MKGFKRFIHHVITTRLAERRAFPPESRARIAAKIAECEKLHSGEIVFALEAQLDPLELLRGETPRQRALELFSSLRVWDTEENCGVLLYVLLADRSVEIVADRGINSRVGDDGWRALCGKLEEAFHRGAFEEGVFAAIEGISAHLVQHFPARTGDTNELPNEPVIL